MSQELILAFIVSIDTYLVAAAYCNSGITIPLTSAAVINLTGAGVLGISLLVSDIAVSFIPAGICRTLGLIVLTSIGVLTVFKSLVRILIRRLSENGELSLRTGKEYNAAKICAKLGGGGHPGAAGASVPGGIPGVRAALLDALREEIEL